MLFAAGQLFRVIHTVRAPLIVAVFAALILSIPDQTRELYRIMAQDHGAKDNSMWFTLIFLAVVAMGLWVCAHDMTRLNSADAPARHGIESFLSRWLPRCIGLIVPLGVAGGLFFAAEATGARGFPHVLLDQVPELSQIEAEVRATEGLLYKTCWLILALIAIVSCLLFVLEKLKKAPAVRSHVSVIFKRKARILSCVIVASVMTGIISILPVKFPLWSGSFLIILTFVLVLAVTTSLLTGFFDKFGIPIITLLVIWAVLLSVLDQNDNHVVKPIERPSTDPKCNMTLSTTDPECDIKFKLIPNAFNTWLESRKDRDHYKDQPYPVFIVAAAGGGLYAAQHAATVLARLQDRCPDFAQHIFAISGVSGASLGAAAFTGLARNFAPNGPWKPCRFGPLKKGAFEQRAQRFLANDFLSPLVAAALFSDFLQRFLPFSVERFDRAKALETSIEHAWARAVPESEKLFEGLFLDQWDPKGAAPALLLNTTDVDNGQRVVISPIKFDTSPWFFKRISGDPFFTPLSHLHQYVGWQGWGGSDGSDPYRGWARTGPIVSDLKLSTAVVMSARFPWVLPAASIIRQDGPKARLVDGGYFENSGVETAMDLIIHFTQKNESHLGIKDLEKRVSIHLLIIGTNGTIRVAPSNFMSEVLSPVRSMLNARERRGHLAMLRSHYGRVPCYSDIIPICEDDVVLQITLNPGDLELPLGWQLSTNTRALIDLFSGRAEKVDGSTMNLPSSWPDKARRIREDLDAANKAACIIHRILHGRWLAQKRACAKS